MSENNLSKLGAKIVAIGKAIGKVEQDGYNNFSRYDYISYEQLNSILRNILPENKLSIIPSIVSYEEKEYKDGKGKTTIRTIVNMNFKIIDNETGYSCDSNFFGADQDTGGKSMGQAITECCKRFYFKLFNVSSKGEIDPDSKTTIIETKEEVKNASKQEVENIPKKEVKKLTEKDTSDLKMVLLGRIGEITPEERINMGKMIVDMGFNPATLTSEDVEKIKIKKGF